MKIIIIVILVALIKAGIYYIKQYLTNTITSDPTLEKSRLDKECDNIPRCNFNY
jgi:hypothetical protein